MTAARLTVPHVDVTAPVTALIAAGALSRVALRAAAHSAGLVVVGECASAAEAIALASRESPDVCVLERNLPGGALAAAAAIVAPRRPPAVLLVGGSDSPAERRAALLAGASGYVPGEPDAVRLAEALATTRGRIA
jgi:two-component system, NarL family, nitrate/nitrite response regulator NarL